MKRVLVIGGVVLTLMIVAAVIVPYYYKDRITEEAKLQINKRINATVNFDEISISPFKHFPRLAISFENITIKGKDDFEGVSLLEAKELRLGVNPWLMLFQKKTEIRRIKLKEPILNILVLENGKANYDIVTATDSTATDTSSLNLSLEKVLIDDGYITYDDRSENIFIQLSEVNHDGSIEVRNNILDLGTKTKAKEFSYVQEEITYLHRKELDLDMQMELNTKNYRFTFKENKVRINDFSFGVEGAFALLKNGYDMDLRFLAHDSSFKNFLSLIPGIFMEDLKHIKTDGDIAFKGFVKGVYSDNSDTIPRFHLNATVKNGMFKVDTLPVPVKNIQLDFVVENKSGNSDSTVYNVRNFHLNLGTYPVHGRFKLSGKKVYKVDTDIFAKVDISLLDKIYPIKGLSLHGNLNFEFKAKGNYCSEQNRITQVPAFDLNLHLSKGRLKHDSVPSSISNLQFHLVADNLTGKVEETFVRLKDFYMDLDKHPVKGALAVKGYEKYFIDGSLQTDLDLADLQKLYPMDRMACKGKFGMNVVVYGIYDHDKRKFPSIDANIDLKEGWFKTDAFPEPFENIHLVAEALNTTGNYNDTRLEIGTLTYTMEGEPFEVKGIISDLEDYAFDLKVKGRVNLEKLTTVFPIKDTKMKGIIDSDFSTRGKVSDVEEGRYRRIKSEGKMEVSDFEMKSPTLPLLSIKKALFAFTPEKVILESLSGRAGKSSIQMHGELTNYMVFAPKRVRKLGEPAPNYKKKPITGDLVLQCDTLDLNEWNIIPETETSTTPSTATSVAITDTSIGRYGSLWKISERIDFTFDSRINYLQYEDLHITALEGEIRIKDGILSLKETGFNTLDAKFVLTGTYDSRNIEHPVFDFSINVKELDIKRAYDEVNLIRQLAPAASDARGIFSLNYKLNGELDADFTIKIPTLKGEGEVRIANAKINGMKVFEEISKTAKKDGINDPHLKDFAMITEIRDNKVFVKPFSLKISGFETDIEGVSDLSGTMHYIFRIELLPIEKLKIPFHVTGSYDHPKVALGKGHSLPE